MSNHTPEDEDEHFCAAPAAELRSRLGTGSIPEVSIEREAQRVSVEPQGPVSPLTSDNVTAADMIEDSLSGMRIKSMIPVPFPISGSKDWTVCPSSLCTVCMTSVSVGGSWEMAELPSDTP